MLHPLYTLAPPVAEGDCLEQPDAEHPADPATTWLSVAPGGGRVGIAAGDLLEVLDTTRASPCPVCRFRLPLPAGKIGVHPSGNSIVVAGHGSVRAISRVVTEPSFAASVASDWGEPHAVSFDPEGKVLWASFGEGSAHHVCALDWASGTLALIGALSFEGLAQPAVHDIRFHPAGTAVAVTQISAGPEPRARVRLIEIANAQLRALPDALGDDRRSPGPLFHVAGFSTDGAHLATVSPTRIDHWRWPDRSPAERVELQSDLTFCGAACYVGQQLVALLHSQRDRTVRLALFGAGLDLRCDLTYREPDDRHPRGPHRIVDLVPVGLDRLLVVGERRAGLFELPEP